MHAKKRIDLKLDSEMCNHEGDSENNMINETRVIRQETKQYWGSL